MRDTDVQWLTYWAVPGKSRPAAMEDLPDEEDQRQKPPSFASALFGVHASEAQTAWPEALPRVEMFHRRQDQGLALNFRKHFAHMEQIQTRFPIWVFPWLCFGTPPWVERQC